MNDYEWNQEEFASQKSQIRAWLLEGNSITQLEALDRFKCLRLSAIIFSLRDEGLPIITERLQVSPRKRVGNYLIDKEYFNKIKQQ